MTSAAARIGVVGGGMAALRTVESLRQGGFSGRVDVFGAELHPSYSRPPLSKAALATGTDHAGVAFRHRDDPGPTTWHRGRSVAHADLVGGTIHLDDGQVHEVDHVVAATGVRPRRLDLPVPQARRHTLRTLEDAVALRAQLGPDARVVILGAGFIGCEVAATARSLGCTVDVVALDPVPLARAIGTLAGSTLQTAHERAGVRFHLGRTVATAEDTSAGVRLELDDHTELLADVVVEAVGSTCNTEWLEGNGLDLSDGVLTTSTLQSPDHPNLHAVGDVARYPHVLFGPEPRRIEHWQLATETAKTAAASILGDDASPLVALPYFWSDQYAIKVQAFGMPSLADEFVLLEQEGPVDLAVDCRRAGRRVAITTLGMARHAVRWRTSVLDELDVLAGAW
jgi:3-phenylpropionate/trans-cinnamate dioxygenase ferredoxin reductase subunit